MVEPQEALGTAFAQPAGCGEQRVVVQQLLWFPGTVSPTKWGGDGQEAHHHCQGFTPLLPQNSSPAFSQSLLVKRNMPGWI